jgi:hypothetical protein
MSSNDRPRPRPLGGWSRVRVAQLIGFGLLPFVALFLGGMAISYVFHRDYPRAGLYGAAAVAIYWGSWRFLRSRFPKS